MHTSARTAFALAGLAVVGLASGSLPAVAGSATEAGARAQTLTLAMTITSAKVVDTGKRGIGIGDRYVERARLTQADKRVGPALTDCAIVHSYGGTTPAGFPKADYVCTTVAVVHGDQIVFTSGGPYLADKPYDAAVLGGTGRFVGASGSVRVSDPSASGYTLRIKLR